MNKTIIYLYILSFCLFTVFTYFFIDPNFIYLKSLFTGFFQNYRLITTVIYATFIVILFFCYFEFIKQVGVAPLNKLKPLIIIPMFGILAYPAALSFDIFNYVATAKVAFSYFENPYLIMPIEFLGDPVLLFTHAANKIALYGPLWIIFTSLPHYLSFGNYLAALVLFKLFVAVFFFGTIWLIWRMTNNKYCVFYFAANPLVLIETFVGGHNDVVMMFFALLSVYLLKNKKILYAIIILILSILIKYATISLIPLFVYYFYQRIRHNEINWDKFYFLGFLLMLVIFFLSPIREELYPWYAIWPLTFLALVADKKKIIALLFMVLSFSLMLRYIPFMLLGTYFGSTPLIRNILTLVPVVLLMPVLLIKSKSLK